MHSTFPVWSSLLLAASLVDIHCAESAAFLPRDRDKIHQAMDDIGYARIDAAITERVSKWYVWSRIMSVVTTLRGSACL
jgi:hypothetical protein